MIIRALATALLCACGMSACEAAPASTGDPRVDAARVSVASGFSAARDVIFRAEKVVEITGREGSTATIVCGEVNRRGREPSIREGWRQYYYVVSYHPVPVYGQPNLRAQLNDEPGAFDKVSLPAIYASGDYAVLFGTDDAGISDAESVQSFSRNWGKFCAGDNGPISEYILQTWH